MKYLITLIVIVLSLPTALFGQAKYYQRENPIPVSERIIGIPEVMPVHTPSKDQLVISDWYFARRNNPEGYRPGPSRVIYELGDRYIDPYSGSYVMIVSSFLTDASQLVFSRKSRVFLNPETKHMIIQIKPGVAGSYHIVDGSPLYNQLMRFYKFPNTDIIPDFTLRKKTHANSIAGLANLPIQ